MPTIDLETAFLFLSVLVYGIAIFIALLLVCSGIGRMLRRKRREQTWKRDEHAELLTERYEGEKNG